MGFYRGKKIWYTLYVFSLVGIVSSCSSAKYARAGRTVQKQVSGPFFSKHFTGLLVVDPATRDTVINHNSQLLFTPASNTKILTLYTGLRRIPNRVPVARYLERGDSIWFSGTGDPSQLHPVFNDSTLVAFLKKYRVVNWVAHTFPEGRYGPGWAWEDFPYSFSPERSSLPLYGNAVQFFSDGDNLRVRPSLFRDSLERASNGPRRLEFSNRFRIGNPGRDTITVPMFVTPGLVVDLLGKSGVNGIRLADRMPEGEQKTVYGIARDSICALMMVESDNFLAEQLMLLASSEISDTLSFNRVRDSVLADELADLPQQPRWVDGSGLSRYNLLSPASITLVLDKLYRELDRDRLFTFFPKGGENGTLEDWFGYGNRPYIYAKSGTLGNTYCLSGYLLTDSGRVLIFSFMNNHFTSPLSTVKREMEAVLLPLKKNL